MSVSIKLPLDDDAISREVDIVAYRDGYFRSSNNTPDELLDRIFGNLAIILQYRDKLTPFSELLEDYIGVKSLGIGETKRRERMRTNRAFKKLVQNHFTAVDFDESEIEVCMALIANIGIELCKIDLTQEDLPEIAGFDGDNIDYKGKISDFFAAYATLVEDGFRPDFDQVAGHLYHIMTASDEYDTLTEMLRYVEETYDI
ncbi:hypothetical protein [Halomarina pelagica]|uniref:hypothetical protein n=1 Tax=Halomarina pelagica TaxID=2961599 RepID=UPI0020C2065C|nr:hypothetical protein [Halomarina sp. BND7]